jgi:hypothetical protein
MSWFTEIISGGVDKIVDSVGSAIDKNFTTDHERLQMQNELEKIKLDARLSAAKLEQEAEAKLNEEISKRWVADMSSDEPLAKKVRPLSLVYLLLFMSIIIVSDSIEPLAFDVKESYVDLIQILLLTVFAAYFGGRTLEKMKRS